MLAVGEVARNMMLVSHLRLVVSVARQYQNLGLDTADLIQVCMYFWNTLQKSVIFHWKKIRLDARNLIKFFFHEIDSIPPSNHYEPSYLALWTRTFRFKISQAYKVGLYCCWSWKNLGICSFHSSSKCSLVSIKSVTKHQKVELSIFVSTYVDNAFMIMALSFQWLQHWKWTFQALENPLLCKRNCKLFFKLVTNGHPFISYRILVVNDGWMLSPWYSFQVFQPCINMWQEQVGVYAKQIPSPL